jgi:hypothetical protein
MVGCGDGVRLKPPLVMRNPPSLRDASRTRVGGISPRRRTLQYERRFQSCGIRWVHYEVSLSLHQQYVDYREDPQSAVPYP